MRAVQVQGGRQTNSGLQGRECGDGAGTDAGSDKNQPIRAHVQGIVGTAMIVVSVAEHSVCYMLKDGWAGVGLAWDRLHTGPSCQ